MPNQNSKNCWIIGASNGIGEALAKKYFSNGYNLMISARDETKLQELAEQLTKTSKKQKIIPSALDVCDVSSLQKSFDKFLQEIGKIDLIIFCSAIYTPTSAIGFDLSKASKTIDVNLKGAINLLHVVLKNMSQEKHGHIAFLASVAGYRGLPKSFAYGASKAGLINLCEGIYPELQKHNINLSVINPGFVKTRLTDKNKFKMPFIINSTQAADKIFEGIKSNRFEIHFPKQFTYFLKLLKILPNSIFLFISKKILPNNE